MLTIFSLIYPKLTWDKNPQYNWLMVLILCLGLSLACSLTRKSDADTQTPVFTQSVVVSSPAPTPLPIQDASASFSQICFDGLAALAGQRLVIGDSTTLDVVYQELDSRCGEAVPRLTIDFASQIFILVIDTTRACDATYQPMGLENNQLVLQFTQTGDCPFDIIALYAGTLARSTDNLQGDNAQFQVVVIGT